LVNPDYSALASNVPFGFTVFVSTLSVGFAMDANICGQVLYPIFKNSPHQWAAVVPGVESNVILVHLGK